MEECPHIFFAGNQHEYAASTITGPDKQKAPFPFPFPPLTCAPHTCPARRVNTLAQSPHIPRRVEDGQFVLPAWLAELPAELGCLRPARHAVRAWRTSDDRRSCYEAQGRHWSGGLRPVSGKRSAAPTAHLRFCQQVLVLSLPSFATSKTAVLVNMRTLQARPIDFSCDAFD